MSDPLFFAIAVCTSYMVGGGCQLSSTRQEVYATMEACREANTWKPSEVGIKWICVEWGKEPKP